MDDFLSDTYYSHKKLYIEYIDSISMQSFQDLDLGELGINMTAYLDSLLSLLANLPDPEEEWLWLRGEYQNLNDIIGKSVDKSMWTYDDFAKYAEQKKEIDSNSAAPDTPADSPGISTDFPDTPDVYGPPIYPCLYGPAIEDEDPIFRDPTSIDIEDLIDSSGLCGPESESKS